MIDIPEKEPFEGKATQKQKQKIWELGYKDEAVIAALGKKQASFLIDQLIGAQGMQKDGPKCVLRAIGLGILGGIFWAFASEFKFFRIVCYVLWGFAVLQFIWGIVQARTARQFSKEIKK